MAKTVTDVRDLIRSPMALKLFRYSMASVVAIIVSQTCFLIFTGVINMDAVLASTLATAIATVPSYEMNRKWAWGKSGKSHFWREVAPFWGLAVFGWAFSTLCVYFMQKYAQHHHFSHAAKTIWVDVVFVGAFGVLWVGKFIIFNKVMFVHHHHHHDDASPTPAGT